MLADSIGYVGLLTFSVAFGLTSACIGPLIPTLIISFLDADSLASGSGYVLVFEAIGQLLGAPAAGKEFRSSSILVFLQKKTDYQSSCTLYRRHTTVLIVIFLRG